VDRLLGVMGAVLLIKNTESIAGEAKLCAIAAPCVRGDILTLRPFAFLGLPPPLLLLFFAGVLLPLSDVTAGIALLTPGERTRCLLF